MNHLAKHSVGYLTIFASVLNVLIEKLESGWPKTPQDWTLLSLNTLAAFCASAIAYRAVPGATPQLPTTIVKQP
jgi:hypothetical protein